MGKLPGQRNGANIGHPASDGWAGCAPEIAFAVFSMAHPEGTFRGSQEFRMDNMDSIDRAIQLIENREQGPDQLNQAEAVLKEHLKGDANSARAYGLLAQIQYWRGEVSSQGLLEIYQAGVDYGKKGVELDENNLESQFWLSVNYGFYGETRGILSSLFLIDPIEHAIQKSLEIDESYFFGGPHRAMGWFLHRVPPWPLGKGDNRKALKHLEKALEYGPDFYLNRLYIAQVLIALRDKDGGRKHLEWIIAAPLSSKHPAEDQRYKDQARQIMEKNGLN
ncbi:MAG TPA: hypothetical protein DEA96_04570 [Leptospiraceae bacterium]|nr:hypothetical protein [Spirochaetaceae bacterium]HBS04216.1 hypothetical protein [Leptospiraceae bacterium]|tara:strand:- start:73602 stop:74435 length:834 start_codon:yes stop_codon:yes gene_type:complete